MVHLSQYNIAICFLYKVIEFDEIEDFKEPKSFTKSDLRSGDVVVRRNGDAEIVCLETKTLILPDGFDKIEKNKRRFDLQSHL